MQTYAMTVKARSRKFFKNFLKKNLKGLKNKRKRKLGNIPLKVLCFPGPEGLEVSEVYDQLGIPRQNITCLERDSEAYQRMKQNPALSGCQLVNISFGDFVKEPSRGDAFDIVSLDFMGQFATFEKDIAKIKNHMSKQCVIFTNFCGARESKSAQAYYKFPLVQEQSVNIVKNIVSNSSDIEDFRKNMREYEDIWNKDLKTQRDEGLTKGIVSSIYMGDWKNHKLLHIILDYYREVFEQKRPDLFKLQKEVYKGNFYNEVYLEYVRDIFVKHIKESLIEKYNISPTYYNKCELIAGVVHTAIFYFYPPFDLPPVKNSSSYKYISSNGMPMMVDMFYIENTNDQVKPFIDQIINPNASTFDEMVSPLFDDNKNWDQLYVLCHRIFSHLGQLHKYIEPAFKGYQFIGSEKDQNQKPVYHPKVENKQYTKEQIIALIKQNPEADTEKLAMLANVSKGSIAAYKAHQTMGTYD